MRQRPIQQGYVFKKGPSWFVRYREDVRDPATGEVSRRQPAVKLCATKTKEGKAVTKREAERLAWDQVLSKLNQISIFPATLATVAEFWESKFSPDVISTMKPAGQKHYAWTWQHLQPAIGALSLREVSREHIQQLVRATLARGLSTQVAAHLKNASSALFRYAKATGYYQGENPAAELRLPPMKRKEKIALTFGQAFSLVEAYPSPAREMVYLSLMTSMNVAEMLALREQWVNLDDGPQITRDEVIPPCCAAVRENCYRGSFCTEKSPARRRIVPLTPRLVEMLRALIAHNRHRGPESLVFQTRNGTPLSDTTLARRVLRPVAKSMGIAGVSWHVFRRCTATWADLVEMPIAERQALLGHSRATMTLYYTQADMARRRPYLEEIERRIWNPENPPQPAADPAEFPPPITDTIQ